MNIVIARSLDPDRVAGSLGYLGRLGRAMPPAWDGAAISVPVLAPNGNYVGRILPGRGLFLAHSLKELGLHRVPRHVFPEEPILRLMDAMAEGLHRRGIGRDPGDPTIMRAAITTYDGIINARGGGNANDVTLSKTSITTVANTYSTLFRMGGFPVAGTYTNIPGGAVHTRASTGAWSFGLSNPGAGTNKYLLTFGFTTTQIANMLILVDLLVAAGNINANDAAVQTVNSTAQTRQYGATLGAGVMMTFDITTALGATASNLVVTYTDQDGNGGAVTPAIAMLASGIVMRLTPVALGPFMELASGDYGVRSVESFDLSAAMGAGVVALNLYFPLAFVPGIVANVYVERDSTVQIDGLTELVKDGSNVIGCLTVYEFCNTTSTGNLTAFIRAVTG